MSDNTKIEWAEATWNALVGCSVLSPGCTNCYAMKMAGRLEAIGSPIYQGLTTKTKAGYVWNGKVELSNHGQVIKPLSWRAPRRIFVNSMSDLFHESVPDEWIDKISVVMALCPQHEFLVLTKRAKRMREYVSEVCDGGIRFGLWAAHGATIARSIGKGTELPPRWPLPNVWLLVSAEDQCRADERIPELLATPAAVRGVSYEPALEEIHIERYLPGLDWVICGGESGPHARPFSIEWARSIAKQCQDAEIPLFIKQMGARPTYGYPPSREYLRDRKGGDISEFPQDLQIREYPR